MMDILRCKSERFGFGDLCRIDLVVDLYMKEIDSECLWSLFEEFNLLFFREYRFDIYVFYGLYVIGLGNRFG